MDSTLDPDTALDVRLSAICTRNQYTTDPAPVIAELREAAQGRDDVIVTVVGSWAGYYSSPDTRILAEALVVEFSPHEKLLAEGRGRARAPRHGAPQPGPTRS